MSVRTKIIRIGNSQGVRIPKILLEEADLGDDIELTVKDGNIVIRAVKGPRQGWAAAFQEMAKAEADHLLDEPTSNTFDDEEWEW